MNEIVILSTDPTEFRFVGEVVHEAKWSATLDDELSRAFSLSLFAVEGGGFVAAVEFTSDVAMEGSSTIVEETDCLDDVEKFFYVFDIYEVIDSVAGASRPEKERRTFAAKQLAKQYEKLMFRFLDEVKSEIAVKGFADRIQEPTAKGNSVWNMFRSK